MRPLQALVLAVCWVSCTASSDRVSLLTESTYDAFAAAHPLFVVQFYAPWCGHSRALAPEYDAAASMLEALPLAKVDGTEAEALATRLDVKGYPTIFFIRDGIADEYDGERTRDAITRWARAKQSPTLALLESSEALDEYTADARLAPVLFLTKPIDQTSDAYRAMLGVAGAIGVPCAVSTAAPPPEVSAPALVVFKSYDEPRAVYTGELQRQQMEKFIQTEELPWLVKYDSNVEDSLFSSDAPLHGFYLHGGEELDGTTVDALKGAAKLLRGRVVFAEVDISADATASKELADFFDVKPSGELATPALAAFSLADGTKFVHSGAIETEQIVAFMQNVLNGQAEPYLRSQPVPEQVCFFLLLTPTRFPTPSCRRFRTPLPRPLPAPPLIRAPHTADDECNFLCFNFRDFVAAENTRQSTAEAVVARPCTCPDARDMHTHTMQERPLMQ